MESWMQELLRQIEEKAGKEKTAHYQTVILPQIIADFYKMLNNAPVGELVREDYHMEDESMTIIFEGERKRSGFAILKAEVE